MPNFYVSNYHSKKALSKAVANGMKVSIKPIPLSREQQKQNLIAEASGVEPPHSLLLPLPNSTYEIQGSFNKQVPFYTATVTLDSNGFILKVV